MDDFPGFSIDDSLDTGTAIAITSIDLDPLGWLELRPVSFGLMAPLDTDNPLRATILKPCIA